MNKMRILICNSKNWFKLNDKFNQNKFQIKTLNDKALLSRANIKKFNPDYIFFIHWNWIVTKEIYDNYNCILFHTGPLPFGRGGSPIQNLILRGFESSPVCALKMIKELDAGPIYVKKKISLKGKLSSIFKRLNHAINNMIYLIITTQMSPVEQRGTPFYFTRLGLEDNRLPLNIDLKQFYDRVRMLDSEDYPKAYIEYGNLKLEFSEANFTGEILNLKCKVLK